MAVRLLTSWADKNPGQLYNGNDQDWLVAQGYADRNLSLSPDFASYYGTSGQHYSTATSAGLQSALDVLENQQFPGVVVPKTVRQVTNRTAIPSTKSGGSVNSGWRAWQMSFVPISAIQIIIANFYVSSTTSGVETGAGGVLNCYLSVEYPKGTFTRITWNGGSQFGVIADNSYGATDLFPLGFTIPAFAKFRIAGYNVYPSGGTVLSQNWSNNCDRSGGDEYQTGAGVDNTMNSTVMGSALVGGHLPSAVMALSDRGVWATISDSIGAGVNDMTFDPSGGRGLFGRSLAKMGPNLNMGIPGDQATQYAVNSTRRRAIMAAAGMTSAILELGVNDLNNARTSAQLLADRVTIRGFFPGVSVFDTTITPSTTSSDGFKTAANQTVTNAGNNTQRTTFNDSLRATPPATSAGIIDIAQVVETSTASELIPVLNGGVWLPGYVGPTDGIHPSSKGYMASEPLITSTVAVLR